MSKLGEVCEHGSLARQCRTCELKAENLGLKHELDNYMLRAEEQIELLKAEINRRRAGAEDLYNTIVMRESTISQLRLEVEKLKARIVFEGKHHLEYVKRIRAKWKGVEAERDRYQEELYTCKKCGVLRSKAEGGTIFTTCDECWDKTYPEGEGIRD